MGNNQIKLLTGVFIVLCVMAFYPWWSAYVPFLNQTNTLTTTLDNKDFSPQNTHEVLIIKGEETITLKKDNNEWKVNDQSANGDEIGRFFSNFENLRVNTTVSRNPDNHALYGVTSSDGIQITFKQNKSETTYIVGNPATALEQFFIRKDGSDEVYNVTGPFRSQVEQDVAQWREEPPTETVPEESSPE